MKRTFSTELAYVFGIVFVARGVVLMEKADFGVSMVVAPAYLLYRWLSPVWSFVTFGMAEYCLQAVLLLAMCLLLRFRVSYLFSFVTAVVYGFVLDAFMLLGAALPAGSVWLRVIYYVLGMFFCAAGVSAMFHTYDATLGAFMEYAQSMGALVAEIEVFDNNAINVLRVAVYWVPALLALVFRKRLFSDSTRAENLFANMGLISAFILMIGLVQAANLFARMAAYFEIATAITLPWMIKKLFTKRSAQYVTACAAVLYFIYFLYEFGVSKGFGSGYSSITLWQFTTSLFGG